MQKREKWRDRGRIRLGGEREGDREIDQWNWSCSHYNVPAADRIGIVNGSHSPWSLLECREVEAAKVEPVVLLTARGPGEVREELHTRQCVTAAQDVTGGRLVMACGGGRRTR